jgi:DNA primase large subunit
MLAVSDPYFLESLMSQFPFLRQVREYVRSLGLQIGDFADPSMSKIVEAAAARVEAALLHGVRIRRIRIFQPSEDEVTSYPLAMALVAMLASPLAIRRFAASEAERYSSHLESIGGDRIRDVMAYMASDVLGMKVELGRPPYEFRLSFDDYLRYSVGLNEPRWRLVNRILVGGYVLITRPEMMTLIKNGLEAMIARRLEEMGKVDVPDFLKPHVERLRKLLEQIQWRRASVPAKLGPDAWPPCMQALRNRLLAGEPVSHFGNFAAAAFMLRIGMSVDEVVEMYSQRGDFDPRIARYQVEHIAGMKGSRTKYSAPRCSTMQTHGLCIENGRLCGGVRTPMEYYRRKGFTLHGHR